MPPLALKGQKLLAQGNRPGKPAISHAPCKGKSFKNSSLNQHFNTLKTYKPKKEIDKEEERRERQIQDNAFWDDYDNNYNANRVITITNNKLKYSLLAKKNFKKLWLSRSLFIPLQTNI